MFKNSVFSPSVDTKEWLKAAVVRAVKTMAQVALGFFTVGIAINEIDWAYLLSVAAAAGVFSILTSIAGVKEVPAQEGGITNDGTRTEA